MPQRLTLHFDIADRQHELRDSVAPDDFVLLRRDTPLAFPENALAYCADLQAERVHYTLHGQDLPRLFAAPFMYAAQLTSAAGVVSVPFESLEALEEGLPPPTPTLIFSPGRTGSTLLARLLSAAGQPCASEPDMLTQICRFVREDRRRIGFPMEIALQRACLVSLCRALGPSPFIKLRSHCNARPLPILEAAQGARAVFMLRRAHDWALSRHRAFAEPPDSVAAVLREAMDALDKLEGAGAPFTVVWFEDMLADPLRALSALMDNAGMDEAGMDKAGMDKAGMDEAAVLRAMQIDAQAGTSVARDRLAAQVADDGFAAAFDLAWSAARAGADWSAATQARLAAMMEA